MEHLSLLAAAILTFGIGVVHSWLGEMRLIGPLLDPAKRAGLLAQSRFAGQVLRFAWHLTTVAWWGFAMLLAILAFEKLEGIATPLLWVVSLTFLITSLITLATSRARHLAWPVFLAIAGLTMAPVI